MSNSSIWPFDRTIPEWTCEQRQWRLLRIPPNPRKVLQHQIVKCHIRNSRHHQIPYFQSLAWLDLGLNTGLSDHWQTLYSLDQYVQDICKIIIVFANGLGDLGSIKGRVIPKTQKWYLMHSCVTLSIMK